MSTSQYQTHWRLIKNPSYPTRKVPLFDFLALASKQQMPTKEALINTTAQRILCCTAIQIIA
jgi:hypothetical protein